MDPLLKMKNIYERCCSELRGFEIWNGYYSMRYEEFVKFYNYFPEKHFSSALEIGCGIGYQSAFLSVISDHLVASDIDFGSMIKHSRGLELTRDFIEQVGVTNVTVVNANAEKLPFPDNSFDMIYSSYAFQYVPNKPEALAEIKRVLRPGGYFFCILPSTGNRITTTKNYYKAACKKMLNWPFQKKNSTSKKDATVSGEMNTKKSSHTRLLPPPDDEANSFMKELLIYSPAKWTKLFADNKHEIVVKIHSSIIENNKASQGFLSNLRDQFKSNGFIIITRK
ncbi:class I SAM-dependent methyltransferase [Ferruginibacter sp.]